MKFYAVLVLCLVAFFAELALAQDVTIKTNNATSTENNATSSANRSSSANVTSFDQEDNSTSSSNATFSENSAPSANATSSDDAVSTDNATSSDNTTVVIDALNSTSAAENQTLLVPANMTASATNTSSNASESSSNSTGASEGGESNGAAFATQSLNASTADMSMFGVSSECADVIQSCYKETNTSILFEQYLFCSAFRKASSCVAENKTAGNDIKKCSAPERTVLEVFSCGADMLGLDVAAKCKARITQCTTPMLTAEEKASNVTDKLFESKLCLAVAGPGCLDVAVNGALCTSDEINDIKEEVECNGKAALLSSMFLVIIMAVVTKVM